MSKLLAWLLEKLKQREEKNTSKYISKLLTPQKFAKLEKLVGFNIKNRSYFVQALMHRSFLEQNTEFKVSNERLEFLGDSVLSLSVAEYLFENFPEKDEGFLTKVRAKLVNRIALADAGEEINLLDFILVSKNLSNNFKNGSRTVTADALEALIGAIYLDNGLSGAKEFIERVIIDPNSKDDEYLVDENFKSQLLEYAQANHMDNPLYSIVKEEGPQHNRVFTMRVTISGVEYGIGKGKNKKSAEQSAAHAGLQKILNEESKKQI